MLLDKMAISYSNHLFVPVVFVFCLLSLLVRAEDSNGKCQTLYKYMYNFLFYLIVRYNLIYKISYLVKGAREICDSAFNLISILAI